MTDPLVGCYCVKNWDQQQCGSKETVTTNAEFGNFTVPKLHQGGWMGYNKWTGPFGWVLGVKENYLPRAAHYIIQAFFLYIFSEEFNEWQASAEHWKNCFIYPPLSSRCTSCLQHCINLLWFIFIHVLRDHHRENKRLVSRLKGA